MRTPETYYFSNGYITFYKNKGNIEYDVWTWNKEGTRCYTIQTGKLRDQEHLKQLTAIQHLGSVK